jgi:hypothetical protein
MQVQKLRVKAEGLVPAGAYFSDIAARLEEMNAREAALRDELDEEDRTLEESCRKRSAARMMQRSDQHAIM